ncbi:hypothetical protein B0I35DRAFT_59639 [Stachybotrys elegans]|uniref:Uncharacterized protein n=1 Tax=Stachybotrys elegans TaxID=80388 RepID=A0A8K0SMV1_9HYPO|nr:hypothetical protein B0I35DRAFT_59639 [Stachybotrys elegans]
MLGGLDVLTFVRAPRLIDVWRTFGFRHFVISCLTNRLWDAALSPARLIMLMLNKRTVGYADYLHTSFAPGEDYNPLPYSFPQSRLYNAPWTRPQPPLQSNGELDSFEFSWWRKVPRFTNDIAAEFWHNNNWDFTPQEHVSISIMSNCQGEELQVLTLGFMTARGHQHFVAERANFYQFTWDHPVDPLLYRYTATTDLCISLSWVVDLLVRDTQEFVVSFEEQFQRMHLAQAPSRSKEAYLQYLSQLIKHAISQMSHPIGCVLEFSGRIDHHVDDLGYHYDMQVDPRFFHVRDAEVSLEKKYDDLLETLIDLRQQMRLLDSDVDHLLEQMATAASKLRMSPGRRICAAGLLLLAMASPNQPVGNVLDGLCRSTLGEIPGKALSFLSNWYLSTVHVNGTIFHLPSLRRLLLLGSFVAFTSPRRLRLFASLNGGLGLGLTILQNGVFKNKPMNLMPYLKSTAYLCILTNTYQDWVARRERAAGWSRVHAVYVICSGIEWITGWQVSLIGLGYCAGFLADKGIRKYIVSRARRAPYA